MEDFVRKLFNMPADLWDIEVVDDDVVQFVSRQWRGPGNRPATVTIDLSRDSPKAVLRVPPRNSIDAAVMQSRSFQNDIMKLMADAFDITKASVDVEFVFGWLYITIPAKAAVVPRENFNYIVHAIYEIIDNYVAWVIDNIRPELIDTQKITESL